MKIFWKFRQLPELERVSAEEIPLMKQHGTLNSLHMGRALLVVMLCLPNAITAQISFTARHYFWPTPLLVSILLSVVIFLVFNHRELVRDREKIRRYLESKVHEGSPREP
jgi:uncharacterized integral membrane protein